MAFKADEFRANISAVNGLAALNKFAVFITPPPFMTGVDASLDKRSTADLTVGLNDKYKLADARVLSMLCHSVNLAGKSLDLVEYRPQGFGKISKLPYDVHNDPLTASFYLDNDHRVLNFMEYWFQEIMNTSSEFSGTNATFKNRTAYELNYKKNYATTMIVQFYANGNEDSFIQYEYKDVFPIQLSSVELAWDQNDQIARLPVEFSFSGVTPFKGGLSGGTYATRGVDYYQPSGLFGSLLSTLTDRTYGGVRNLIETFTDIDI